jgi:DNA-binding response OmpR family regulator
MSLCCHGSDAEAVGCRKDYAFARKRCVKTIDPEHASHLSLIVTVDRGLARLSFFRQVPDVVVLDWPDQERDATRLAAQNIPCLFLVAPGAEPPIAESDNQDWVWFDARDSEIEARLLRLSRHAAANQRRPTVEEFGKLSHNRISIFLSPIDERLAEMLVENFGKVVGADELIATMRSGGGSPNALRVHISRLRRRVRPLGLEINAVRSHGYAMTSAEAVFPA